MASLFIRRVVKCCRYYHSDPLSVTDGLLIRLVKQVPTNITQN